MFSLMYGFWQCMARKTEYYILILGLDRAGKTLLHYSLYVQKLCVTLVLSKDVVTITSSNKYCTHYATLLEQMKAIFKDVEPLPPDQIMPTVGLNIGRLEVGNVKLIFWDLGGQSELRSIWDKYFRETHGLVFVVDSADPSRFNEAKNELEILVRTSELRGVPFLFFVNKQDIDDAITPRQLEEVFNTKQIQSTRPLLVQPLKAINGEGVRDGVMWLVETLKKCARKTEQDL